MERNLSEYHSHSQLDEKDEQDSGLNEGPKARPASPPKPGDFPDGGASAWLCVFGGFCSLFVSFGWINCVGLFQDYYQTHQLSSYPASTVAWITSLEVALMFAGGPLVGRMTDRYGPRWILLLGSFLHVFGLMMASLSTKYYQLLLSQSVCSAAGASMIFYPSLSSTMTWFMKKRALATGIVSSGSGLGGVIFPIMVQKLVPQVGFAWALRICAFLVLGLTIPINLFVRSRLPPQPKEVKLMDFVRPLGELPFALFSCGMLLYFFGQFIPFTFIVLEATERGMSQSLATYLVSIINAASIFGRIAPAALADRYGRFNLMVIMASITFILIYALWIPAQSNAGIIVFSTLFGFTSGIIVGMAPALVAQISEIREIGVRTGTMFTFVAVAILVSNPIAGALVDANNGKYVYAQIFAGSVMAGGTMLYVAARVSIGGWRVAVKV